MHKNQKEQVASTSSSHVPTKVWEGTHYMNNGANNLQGIQTQNPTLTTHELEIMQISYPNPNNDLQPSHGSYEQAQPRKPSFEETLDRHEAEISEMKASVKKIEKQVGQIA